MAKKGRPKKAKRGRPKKVVPTVKVKKTKISKPPKKELGWRVGKDELEVKVKGVKKPELKVPEAPKPTVIKKPIIYKEEIVVLGKKVKRLNDGRDTDLQFHCEVDDGTTAHFDKELFKQ